MMRQYAFLFLLPLTLILFSCPMPNGLKDNPTAIQSFAQPATDAAQFSVENDAARAQAVFVDAGGTRFDVQSLDDDGAIVACVDALGVVPLREGIGAKGLGRPPALVIGTTRNGKPGAWVVTPDNKVQPVIDEESGRMTSCLPETDEKAGTFRGRFGWIYNVMGSSEDGKLIAGYAENDKGFSHGRWKIEAGTTIGVYWRVWKHSSQPYFVVSHARIIGTYDTSRLPVPGRRNHLLGDWRRRKLDQLKWLLLDYLSGYFVMVEKNGVHKDPYSEAYLVTGTDQDGEPAVATIDKKGRITIEPLSTPTELVDLSPGRLTVAAGSVADGNSLAVSLPIQNLQAGAESTPFSVDFYLALSSAFSPSTDTKLGSLLHSSGVPGSSSITLDASLAIPDALDVNQLVYIYAEVDAAGAVTETDRTNNRSTAAVVLIYDDENASRAYPIILETYSPSGTGRADTLIALYKKAGGKATYVQAVNNFGPNKYARMDTGGAPLTAGTYYALVLCWPSQEGPYAMAVKTGGVDNRSFAELGSNAQDTYETDNTPNVYPVEQDLDPLVTPFWELPTAPVAMGVGTMVNRYSANNDWDWFTFTLP